MNYHRDNRDDDDNEEEEEEEEEDTKALRQKRLKNNKSKSVRQNGDFEQRIKLRNRRPRQSISWDPECDEEDYEQFYAQ